MKNINKYKKSDISQKIEVAEPYEIIHELLSNLNKKPISGHYKYG